MRRQFGDISVFELCTETIFARLVDKMCRYLGFYSCASCNRYSYTVCGTCITQSRYIPLGLTQFRNFDHLSFFYYTKVIKKVVGVYKFELAYQYQRVLEELLRDYMKLDPFRIRSLFSKYSRILIVPVPMTKRKQADRGFSPAEELSIMVGRTVRSANSQVFLSPNFLLKVKETKPQSKKHRIERLLSINRAFQVNDCAIPALLQYVPDLIIVVDDVYTTGATITEIWDNIKKHAIFEQLPKTTWISFSFARSLR